MWHELVLVGGLGAVLLWAGGKIHVVEKGDTLYQISREYRVDIAELIRANPRALGGGKTLKVGTRLTIPVDGKEKAEKTTPAAPAEKAKSNEEQSGEKKAPVEAVDDNDAAPAIYVVKKGDTLSGIGRRFKISAGALRELNGIKGNTLRIGQKLKVRAAPVPAPTNVVKTPANSPVATGGQSVARSASTPIPAAPTPPSGKQRYLFIDKIKDKLDKPRVVPGRWKYVVVHHSGTPSGNAKIFDYFHRNIRGMENGLAYHFVIGNGHDSGDGEIEVGDRWMRQIQGGHLRSDELNEIALGICFVGDFNSERPTKKQIAAAIELITYLNQRCGTPPIFKAHREINPKPTECPGTNFPIKAFHQLFDR